MTIYAAILLLASTGSASRETTVPVSIERVLWGVVMGGVRDVARSMLAEGFDISTIARLTKLTVEEINAL